MTSTAGKEAGGLQENGLQFIQRIFTSLAKDEESTKKLCDLLELNPVSSRSGYFTDPIVSKLYWKNLLKKDENDEALSWRCDLIRDIGKQILHDKN